MTDNSMNNEQYCPVHSTIMEYAKTVSGEQTWTCEECSIDYFPRDLRQEQ